MRRILVTGGFGFIGQHLVELLLRDEDVSVHVVDDLSSSPLPFDDALEALGQPKRLSWSLETVQAWAASQTPPPFDGVFHLASVVGPAGVLQHAGRIAGSIMTDSALMADLAAREGVRLVDVSTSEVYGGGRGGLCAEDMPRIIGPVPSPRLEYAVGKLAAETSLLNRCRADGLDAVIIRPFNVTGPRQSGRGGFVLPRFIGQAMAGLDLTVFGDGSQQRAFTHVHDIASGIALAMQAGASGQVYNVGNPANRCSIAELAADVIEITGSSSHTVCVDGKTVYGPLYEEAHDKFPDASKAMHELGWMPAWDRRATVEDTYRYMCDLPEGLLHRLRGF